MGNFVTHAVFRGNDWYSQKEGHRTMLDRRRFIRNVAGGIAGTAAFGLCGYAQWARGRGPNVLFIAIDDLND